MFFKSYIQSEVKKALGVVTPEMYNGDLQKCLDDERPSWFTKPFYEIEETLHINNPFKIVYGNYSQLLPLDNIDVFSLNAREFLVKDLILNTQRVEHSKAGFLIDLNKRIWGGKLDNVRVEGKRETLYQTGMGTKAIYFDTEMKVPAPYVTDLEINATIRYCANGVLMPKQDNNGLWVNNIRFDTKMRGCKQYYHIAEGDMFEVFTTEGDEAVLNEDEKNTFANIFYTKKTNVYIKPHDFRRKDTSIYHRHGNNFLLRSEDKSLIVENTAQY